MFGHFPKIKQNEPLAKHCTFKIGGPADYFYELTDLSELPALIQAANHKQIPYFLFGAGTNLLFSDHGFRGLIIKIAAKKITLDKNTLTAESGALISDLITTMLTHNLAGLEPWVGLPGTVGGAVYGNAGCSGLETKDCLISAEIFHPQTNQTTTENPKTLDLHYRHSNLKGTNKIVLSGRFQLQPCKDKQAQTAQITALRQDRFRAQPFGVLTTGSFFKNPIPDKPAGLLIEQAGLKGHRIGSAMISDKHANFFINKGTATATEILQLMELAQKTVQEKFQITLTPEVQIIPESPL